MGPASGFTPLSKLSQQEIVESRVVGARYVDTDTSRERTLFVDTENTSGGDEDAFLRALTGQVYVAVPADRMIWNRQHFVKDPQTGKRQARPNPETEWVIQEVPELRLLEQELWDAVKERQGITRRVMETEDRALRPERARRTRYLLSGLVTCGCCGGAYTLVGGQHYGCASARNKGTCDNRRMIHRSRLEDRVLGGLRDKLLHPDLIAAFVEEFQREYTTRPCRPISPYVGYGKRN